MSPALATKFAINALPWRVHALLVSVLAMGLVAASMFAVGQWQTRTAFTLAGPVVGLSWAALCAASWFHPVNGTLSSSARFVGKLPGWLRNTIRWYASLFLAFFILFCAIAWPLFSLSNLWHLVE